MRGSISILLVLDASCSFAHSITVGDTTLEIPDPTSFAAVTAEMKTLYELQKTFVPPTNVEFISFIPELETSTALKGELPDLERRFSLQTAVDLVSISVSSSGFAKLNDMVKSRSDDLREKIEKEISGAMERINKGLSVDHDLKLALSVSQMMPLAPHQESDRTFSYSTFVKYNMKDESGNPTSFITVVTTTFLHVKGKVLFLYSHAGEKDLDWSRSASAEWAEAVVKSNPSNIRSAIKEALPSSISGIDWTQVGMTAAIGAFVGLVLGVVGWVVRRGKQS